jgi:hypothetical protein
MCQILVIRHRPPLSLGSRGRFSLCDKWCSVEYTKEFKEREELLHQLEDRGLAIPDRAEALKAAGEHTKFDAWTKTWREAVTSGAEDKDFSFGNLPFLYDLMPTPDARSVARMFGFVHPSRFGACGAVLRMMVDFRNTCAQGSRLFNRAFNPRTRHCQRAPGALARTRLHGPAQSASKALYLRRRPGVHAQFSHERHKLAPDLQDASQKTRHQASSTGRFRTHLTRCEYGLSRPLVRLGPMEAQALNLVRSDGDPCE